MRTILFTHPSAELYGADRTLLQLVEAVGRRDGMRAVVALPRRGVLAGRLEAAGALVEVGELGAALRADLQPSRLGVLAHKTRAGARFVGELVERHGADLVHTNTTVLVGAALGAHRSGAKHVWHVHEILEGPGWARGLARTLLARWSDVAVANSRATAAAMVPTSRCAFDVVHNGVDLGRVDGPFPDAATIKERHGIPPHARLVVLPGRVNGWKGQPLLVEAAGRGRRWFEKDVHFVMAGSAPPGQEHFVRELKARVATSGVGSFVHHVPFTEDLPALLAAADLCVVPSLRPEPFGLVAIEAMAVGTPVLAAGHGGIVEAVEDGVTGRIFPTGDVDALIAGIRGMLGAPRTLERMGACGRRRVRAHFTADRYVERMVGIYRQVLGDEHRIAEARRAA